MKEEVKENIGVNCALLHNRLSALFLLKMVIILNDLLKSENFFCKLLISKRTSANDLQYFEDMNKLQTAVLSWLKVNFVQNESQFLRLYLYSAGRVNNGPS
jgi:hypothetical protein